MSSSPDAITRLFRACEPNEPLQPTDPRYVNCDDVRGHNLVEVYVRSLRRADPAKPEVKLFAGHRGVGKTCELNRLKALLEAPRTDMNPHLPFRVLYLDASDKLDLNDLDLPDLLTFIAAEVLRQLGEQQVPGFDPVSTLMKQVWDDIRTALKSDVAMKEVGVDAGFASLTLELKHRPNSRQKLREAIELHTTSLLSAVNDLLQTANVKLRRSGHEGLVLLVDGLERLVLRPLPDSGSNTHDRLFLDRSEQLASLKAHTIFTVPISLVYSPRCADLEQAFGEQILHLPVMRVHERGRPVSPDTPGMRKLREIVDARCACAQVDPKDVFDNSDTADYLCRMTGGHPRHLLMFLRAAMNTLDGLPITRAAAEKAVSNYAGSLLREVPDAFWPKLRAFATPQEHVPWDEAHQQMLFLLYVLEYMNGRVWYEVNPVIRTLPRFRQSE